jgi:hypothetical protein
MMAFQDPAQKLYTPLDEVVPCAYHHGRMPCPANAFKYDEDPQRPGNYLCREHRTWSWLGAWEQNLWSLRLWPKPDEAWWAWCGPAMNYHGYDSKLERYDLSKVFNLVRNRGPLGASLEAAPSYPSKVDIVLPTEEWLLGWAKRQEQKRIEKQVKEARRRLESGSDSTGSEWRHG